jgi:phage/conjugal plasmid C-4 type zinc finger TraR family protein
MIDTDLDRTEDEAGIAQAHQATMNMNAIAEHQRRMAAAGPSLSHCEECGDAIPEARQKHVIGCRTCIECQKMLERYKKIHGYNKGNE